MTVALSSLRVTSDFDASGYSRGAAQKVAADQAMIAADKARNASLAQADAAMARAVPGMAAVSRSLLEGYSAGSQFEAIVRRIGNAVDRGMGLDRANMLLDAAYRKFGLTADAAGLARAGFVSIAEAVGVLNGRYEQLTLAAQSAAKAVERSSTQSGINQSFGIGADPAKSAQDSADAFMSAFGGLEGLARAKAQEAGDAFSQDLDRRLIAGAAKSARDASNVFDLELKRIETIAQQRAEQAGSNFQRSLTEALGGGGASATSQGATYSALAEEVERLDRIEQARSAHNAEQFQRNINLAAGIDRQAKSAKDSAASFIAAAEAEERMATKAALLRAQINPLDVEMVKLGKDMAEYRAMLNAGVISHTEFAQAQAMAAKRLSDVDMNLRKAATGGRVMAGEMVNLGYQVNDVVTGLMLGQPVLMIAAQQGGQIYQIFQTSKASVGDFAKEAGSKLAGLATPATAAFGTIAAAIGVTIVALSTYQGRMAEVQRQITGMGRASGASALTIDAIAQQNASGSGFSVNEARQMAAGLAATGKIGVDSIGPIVALGHDFAKTFGVDAKEATDLLAKAFADPARGAEELNQRLGFLDAKTKLLIESLVIQGDRTEAVRILTEKIRGSIAQAADITGFWSRMANGAGNALSDFFDRVGRGADRVFNGGANLPEKIQNLTIQLLDLQKAQLEANQNPALAFLGGYDAGEVTRQIAAIKAQIEELRKKRADLELPDNEARTKQRGLEIDAIARATLPAVDATRRLEDETKALNQAFNDPSIGKWVSLVGGDLVRALQRKDAAFKASVGFDPVTTQIADTEAQIKALDRRSIADRARFAREAEARRQANDPNAGTKAERDQKQDQAARLAAGGQTALDGVEQRRISTLGNMASIQEVVRAKQLELDNANREGIRVTDTQRKALLDLAREQALGITQIKGQIDSTNVQAAAFGMGAGAAAAFTAKQNILNEAVRQHRVLTDEDKAAIDAQARALGEAVQASAIKAANSNVRFDIDTTFLTDAEKQVASLNRQLYGDNWRNYANDALSNQMRISVGMRDLSNTLQDANRGIFTDMSQQIRNGANAFDALRSAGANALGKIADKLASMAADNLWNSAFGGKSSGGLLSLLGIGGGGAGVAGASSTGAGFSLSGTGGLYAEGGWTGPGSRNQPAGIVHAGEYVFSQSRVQQIGLANLERLHRGYADGGLVTPMVGGSAPSSIVGGSVTIDASDNRTMTFGNDNGKSDIAAIRYELERDRMMRKEQIIGIVRQARIDRRL